MTRPQRFGLQIYTRLSLEDEEAFTRLLIERKCSPSELARELIHRGLQFTRKRKQHTLWQAAPQVSD